MAFLSTRNLKFYIYFKLTILHIEKFQNALLLNTHEIIKEKDVKVF
jgi:hypothetical protein